MRFTRKTVGGQTIGELDQDLEKERALVEQTLSDLDRTTEELYKIRGLNNPQKEIKSLLSFMQIIPHTIKDKISCDKLDYIISKSEMQKNLINMIMDGHINVIAQMIEYLEDDAADYYLVEENFYYKDITQELLNTIISELYNKVKREINRLQVQKQF